MGLLNIEFLKEFYFFIFFFCKGYFFVNEYYGFVNDVIDWFL